MNRATITTRIATLAVLALAFVATDQATIAHQGSTGVEEVVALNQKYKNLQGNTRRLTESPDFSILVEGLSDDLNGKVTQADIEKWIKAELGRSAPNAVVVTDKQQDDRLETPSGDPTQAKNLEGYLKRRDAAARFLYLRLSYLENSEGVSFYDITVEFNRIGVTPTGAGFCTIFSTGGYGTFSGGSTSDKLRTAISNQVKKFSTAWNTANGVKE